MIKSGRAVIFHTSLHPVPFLLALFMLLMMPQSGLAADAGAQLQHLRLVYGEERALSDGTVLLPLEIHFDNVQGGGRLENLSDVTVGVASLPAFGPSVKQTKPLVYRSIPVIKTGDKWTIQLSTGAPRSFAVRVQARSAANGKTTYLTAETNCFVFGRKLGTKVEPKAEALPPAWSSGLGMSINPPFYYWPQTETPLQVTLHLGSHVLPKTTLTVFDGYFPPARFLTDHAGRVDYVPPDDPALNRHSEKAAKQVFLVSVHSEGDDLFVATRTLRLYRNRLSHLRMDMGMALFGTTALVTGGTVIWIRRGRRPV
ncbi:MAG: hypothetical protein ABFD57_05805 [Smithella sp.]